MIVSYIGGTTVSEFRKNAGDVALNFKDARASSMGALINKTIPILNDDARGYDPSKLAPRLQELRQLAQQPPIIWSHPERLKALMEAA